MSSGFEALASRGYCEGCGQLRELVAIQSNGGEYALCRYCAKSVHLRRGS